jgi:predicted MFS family arabinose efflux permease
MIKKLVYLSKMYIDTFHGIPSECYINIFLTFLNACFIGICFFLSVFFVDVLRVSVTTAGLLISTYGIGTTLGGIISGKICDNYSPKMISIVCVMAQCFVFLALMMIRQPVYLAFILCILGVASYGFKTANNILLLQQCHSNTGQRLKALNISHVASNLGLGVSGTLVGLLADYGYNIIFLILSASLAVTACYLMITYKKNVLISSPASVSDEHSNNKPIESANKYLLAFVLLSFFAVGLIISQLSSTYPIYVKNAFPALGMKAVSILFILDTAIIVFFQAPLSSYYSRFNTLIVMGLGAFCMGFGMLILSYSTLFLFAIISCCIWTVGEMLFLPTAQLLCYENADRRKKGSSVGLYQATYATSVVVGPIIGSVIYNNIGSNVFWYISFMIGLICLISCCVIAKQIRTNKLLLLDVNASS